MSCILLIYVKVPLLIFFSSAIFHASHAYYTTVLHVTIKQPDLSAVTPIIPLCLRKPPPSSFFAVAPSHINSRQLLYFYHYELLCCKLDASELVFAQKSTQHNNKDYPLIATGIFMPRPVYIVALLCFS